LYNEIEIPNRNMNWDLLTEQFLDCEHSAQEIERTIKALRANGFSMDEICHIQNEIKVQMRIYNFGSMLHESSRLTAFDVLSAMTGAYSNPQDYEKFYWSAMEIEMRSTAPVDFSAKVAGIVKELNKQ
ncbi:unnamed protein product, partial [Symbiodinium microadriaticum]